MDLNSGAVEGGIGRRGGAVEDEDGQISKIRVGGVVEADLVLRQGQLVRDSNHFESSSMASPGPSMGLALHDEKTSRVTGQLAWVLELVSLDVVTLLKVNIRLGGIGWFWKNKSTRRAVPCFSLKMHEPAGSSYLDTQNSMVILQLQHPAWTCRTKVSAQRLTLPLSLDKSENIFKDKVGI